VAAAAVAGGGCALILAFLVVTLRANQIVSGLALTIFAGAAGLSSYIGNDFELADDPARFSFEPLDVLDAEKADHRAHQHHPLHAEVEHARPFREQLAERGEEERCPVRDCGGEDDDDDAVVHVVASAGRTESERSITTR